MGKNINKFIAAFLAGLFIISLFFSCFAGSNTIIELSKPQDSLRDVDGLASVISIINDSIGQQARRIIELSCVTANLSVQKHIPPAPDEKKKKQPCKSAYTAETGNTSFGKCDDTVSRVWPGYAQNMGADKFVIIYSLMLLILFIGRFKIANYFYLLPRGSIDDHITINHIFRAYPRLTKSTGVFYFLVTAGFNPRLYLGAFHDSI